jgi:hypothetical protein
MPNEDEKPKDPSVLKQAEGLGPAAAPEDVPRDPNVQMCAFHDRELYVLAEYLLDSVKPQNLHQQQDFNRVFLQLNLDKFIGKSGAVERSKVETRIVPYEITMNTIAYLVEALNAPMQGRAARVIGAGSGFWGRLLTRVAPPKPEAKGRLAAVPTPESEPSSN